MGLRSLALTSKSLRLLVRRKATRGVALKTLAQRGDEDCSYSVGTWDAVNASYSLVEEGQIVSTFVEIRFEFVCTDFESLVRRTNTSKSESYAD